MRSAAKTMYARWVERCELAGGAERAYMSGAWARERPPGPAPTIAMRFGGESIVAGRRKSARNVALCVCAVHSFGRACEVASYLFLGLGLRES